MSPIMLRALGLDKSFPGQGGASVVVLRGADLEVKRGEYLVVTGPSGSGKSTLLSLLGLLDAPDSGEIWLGEERVTAVGRHRQCLVRGHLIGFIFQAFHLIGSLTAIENVLLAARYVGREKAQARREALALMERLGVAHRVHHYPAQLSGGEQQRVAFCRAVLNDPPLILADEPTGNLDEDHARVIKEELHARARERGTTVVLVTHHIEAFKEADRALRVADGRLVTA
jgi:ABC-type lipoprotein export system ATPase subunit